jgi:DNA polymerase-3 subunit alpha
MYISAHPVAQAMQQVADDPNRLTLSQIGEEHIGQKITLIGMVTGLRRILTKKNETMLLAQIEDLDGAIEMVAFPKVYEKFTSFWKDDNIIALTAKVEYRRETLQLVCENVSEYTAVQSAEPVEVRAFAADFESNLVALDDDAPPPDDPAWNMLDRPVGQIPSVSSNAPRSNGQNGNGHGHAGNGHNGNGNGYSYPGNGHNGNGNGVGNGHAPASNGVGPATMSNGDSNGNKTPETPIAPASAPLNIGRPRQRITIAKKAEPQPSETQPPVGPQYTLHIRLPRTEDYVTDLRSMQEVARHLEKHRGDHKVLLYLPKDDVLVVLEPMERINPAQELVAQLTGLLGEGSVQIEHVV